MPRPIVRLWILDSHTVARSGGGKPKPRQPLTLRAQTSEQAKMEARTALEKAGHEIRSINVSPHNRITAYVFDTHRPRQTP